MTSSGTTRCAIAPPNGESFRRPNSACRRSDRALHSKACRRDIVCVSHGGTVRAAVSHALNLDPAAGMALTVHTLSVTVMEHVPGGLLRGKGAGWRILNVNRPAREDH